MYLTRKRKLFGLLFILMLVLSISSLQISVGSRLSFADSGQQNITLKTEKNTYRIFEVGKVDVKAKSDNTDRYFRIRVKNNNSKIIDSDELNLSEQLKKLDVVEKNYDSDNNLVGFIFKLEKNETADFKLFSTSKNGKPGDITVEGFDGATLDDVKINDNYSDKVFLSWKFESVYNSGTETDNTDNTVHSLNNSIGISDVYSNPKITEIGSDHAVEEDNSVKNAEEYNKLEESSSADNSENTAEDKNSEGAVSESNKSDDKDASDNNSTSSKDNADEKNNADSDSNNTDSGAKTPSDEQDSAKKADGQKDVDNDKSSDDEKTQQSPNTENNGDADKKDKTADNKLQEKTDADVPQELEKTAEEELPVSVADAEKSFFEDYMKYSSSESDDFSFSGISSFIGRDRSATPAPKSRVRRSAADRYYSDGRESKSENPVPKHVKSIEKNIDDLNDDTYRLSLDTDGFSKKKIDVLFIVDTSNSMNHNFANDEVAKNPDDSRWGKLYNIVTKEGGLSDTFLNNKSADITVGLEFFNGNVDDDYITTKPLVSETIIDGNKNIFTYSAPAEVKVVDTPYNDAKKVLDFGMWNKYSFDRFLKIKGEEDIQKKNGTNSQAALHFAVNEMIPKMRKDAAKYVIFLTDGKPDFYYSYSGETDRFPIPNPIPSQLRTHMANKAKDPSLENNVIYVDSAPSPAGYSLGGGQFVNKRSVERALQEAGNIRGIDGFFAVGLSKDAIGGLDSNSMMRSAGIPEYSALYGESALNSDSGKQASLSFENAGYRNAIVRDQRNLTRDFMTNLTEIVQSQNPTATVDLYETLDAEGLEEAMDKIVDKIYSGISISDTLSQYVDYVPTTNYGQGTYLSFKKNGANNYRDMKRKYGDNFYNVTYDPNGKKIGVKLSNKAGLESDENMELGFYVKPNKNAYQTFGQNLNQQFNGKNVELYPDVSSEGVRGFYSNKNDEVTLSYTDDEKKTAPYTQKPVVHIATKSITVEKKWIDAEGDLLPDNYMDIPVEVELRAYPKDTENSSFYFYNNERGRYLSFKKTLDKSNGYKFTFENLPAKYYDYRVVETTKLDNFKTTYSINQRENKATIYNRSTAELPKTGGLGTLLLYTMGALMIMISVIYLKGNELID